jgi:hypothetical protein
MAEHNDFEAIFVSFQYREKTGEQKNSVSDLIDHLLDDLQLKKSDKRRTCISNYISSLLLANRGSNTFNKVIFPQTSDYFGAKGIYAKHYANFSGYAHKINGDLAKALIKNNYITLSQGQNIKKAASIVTATDKLLALISEYHVGLLSFDKLPSKKELVKIRHADADIDKEQVQEHEEQISAYNKLLQDAEISIAGQILSNEHKQYYRSFTNALYKQGRFYSSFCHLNDNENQPAVFNGKETVSLKIPACHILLAYAHQEKDFTIEQDSAFSVIFEGEVIDEEVGEALLMAMINYRNAHTAASSVMNQYSNHVNFKNYQQQDAVAKAVKIINKLVEKHSTLKFQSLSAHALVFQESCIAEKLIDYCVENKIPMLMRHDTFVVPESASGDFIDAVVKAICYVARFNFAKPEKLVAFD